MRALGNHEENARVKWFNFFEAQLNAGVTAKVPRYSKSNQA